jgi:hypothetical protein
MKAYDPKKHNFEFEFVHDATFGCVSRVPTILWSGSLAMVQSACHVARERILMY